MLDVYDIAEGLNRKVVSNIVEYCEANGLDAMEYINDALRDKVNIDRFGEIPEFMIKAVESKDKEKPKVDVVFDKNEKDDTKTVTESVVEKEPVEDVKVEEKPKRSRRKLTNK